MWSWGGFINLLFASQEKILKEISIIYSSAYISHSKWARQERICGNMSESDWDIYNEHIDPQTYLVDIECPVFFTAGTNDTAFTMENRRKTAEKINQLKYFGYREHFEHGNFIGFEQPESDVFFKSFIMNKPIKNICYKLNGKEIRVLNEIKTAQYLLMETTEDYDNEDVLAWTKRPFSRKISLKEDTKTFFIQKKEKGYIFSTDIINVKE